ncbi:hypothetical protein [Streptomyces sp. NPDC004728]|uniref:hypothetical protein n=1 Tax=Streptomyces sp. NPDC004728 TaxID=3154289 RepID=UPI0033AEA48A
MAVLMAVAGCSDTGGGGADEVANVSGGKPSAKTTTEQVESELAEYIDGMRAWVGCMREAGVDLPDPDAKGNVKIDIPATEWKREPKYLRAQEKCVDKQPSLSDSLEKAQQPEPTEEEKAKRREYATCMQDNGAPDFPDVGEDGYFVEENWDSTSAGAKSASRTCDKSVYGVDHSTVAPKG